MDSMRAYGAGLTGGAFDLNAFLKKPTVVFRILALVAGGILWACVAKGGWIKEPDNPHLVAGAIVLLATDANFDKISSVNNRKKAVVADLIASAVFAFLFVITFFTLFSKFSSFESEVEYGTGLPKLAILFSFLSVLFWGGAAFFAWRRYEEGRSSNAFAPNFEGEFAAAADAAGDGYGYGGNSDGIGSVGNTSYQNSAPAQYTTQSQYVPPTTNPFTQQEGYQY